jgi:hypothetical protein
MTSVEDVKCPGHLFTSTTGEYVKIIWESVQETRFLTTCELANEVEIPFGSCQSIQNLYMQCTVTKIVPCLLTDKWK